MSGEARFNALLVKILSAIVVISLSLNVILLINRSETFPRKKYILSENTKLRQQLNLANAEIKRFQGISEKIDRIVRDAESRMNEKEKQISELLRSKNLQEEEYENLIDEIDSLKEEYLSTIDSLLVERKKNILLTESLENMSGEVTALQSQLAVARELQSENLLVEGIKLNRQGKEQNTTVAKKAELLKICFDVLPNKLSVKGEREVYIIITAPDGFILSDVELSKNEFAHPEYNKLSLFSGNAVLNYQNERMHFCANIRPASKLPPGLYLAEVFTEENKLGMATFSLR